MSTTCIEQTLHVVVNLSAEDRARLDKIIAGLEKKDCTKCADTVLRYGAAIATELAQNEEKPAEVKTTPAEPEPQETPQETEPTAPSVTKADVQSKAMSLSQAGKKAEVKAIVTEYADRISAIPEDKLAEVMEKLNALGG